MKPTDFATHLTQFLSHYLAAQRNLSPNTIKSYRDVFKLLLRFCRDVRGMSLERLSLAQVDAPLIEAFLKYLGNERRSSVRTQNHRLAALHAFFRYVQSEVPEQIQQCQQILAIPLRRHGQPMIGYLSKDQLTILLSQPDQRTESGRRDAVLLSVLYDTGARVQELIDLCVGDVRLESPAQVRLMGKGRKMRAVPLMYATTQMLRDYLRDFKLDHPENFDRPLFQNRQGGRFSRSGIRYILQKYVKTAGISDHGLAQAISPHCLRHTKGMHLLQSGISLEIIRDFLGHVDAKTTQIYARANLEMKRKALEKISNELPAPNIPSWKKDKSLLDWLSAL
jgi:integrase/recombinase XerD